MSFSSKVKGELSLHFGNGRHCEIAEIAAYVNIYGQIAVFGGNFCLKIQTENDYAVKKCFTLLRNTFNMIADVSVRISGQKRQTKVYTLLVRDAAAILQATGILTIEKEQKKLKKRQKRKCLKQEQKKWTGNVLKTRRNIQSSRTFQRSRKVITERAPHLRSGFTEASFLRQTAETTALRCMRSKKTER